MPNLVNAYVLYDGLTGIYVGNDSPAPVISINCERLAAYSPRPVWLKRMPGPGDGTVILYELTFNPTSQETLDTNTLQGMYIMQDEQGVMVDVTTVAAFQAACDACCGAVPAIIASNYNGAPTAYAPLGLNSLCIFRSDDGSAGAHDDFSADYAGQFVNTAMIRSSFSNLTHYTIQSYWTAANFPVQGTDLVYAGACSS